MKNHNKKKSAIAVHITKVGITWASLKESIHYNVKMFLKQHILVTRMTQYCTNAPHCTEVGIHSHSPYYSAPQTIPLY